MAHGSKWWVLAVDVPGGRVKRSRHRSSEDPLGRFAIGATVRKRDAWREFRSCRAEALEYHLPPSEPCRTCRAADKARERTGWHRRAWYEHAPASFRRMLEQQYRARVRYLTVTERYDELPVRARRDAAWLYW